MKLLYQTTWNQVQRMAKYLGFDSWDNVPQQKKREALKYLELMKEVERETSLAWINEIQGFTTKAEYVNERYQMVDKIENLSITKEPCNDSSETNNLAPS